MRWRPCGAVLISLICCGSNLPAQQRPAADDKPAAKVDSSRSSVGFDCGVGILHGEEPGRFVAITLGGTTRPGRGHVLRFSSLTRGDGFYALTLGLERSSTGPGPRRWSRLEGGLLVEAEFTGLTVQANGGVEIPLGRAALRAGRLAGVHRLVPGPFAALVGLQLR